MGSDRFQRYIDRPRQRRPAGAPADLSRNDRRPSAVPRHGSVRVHGAPPSQFVLQTAGHSARTKGDLSRRLPISRLRLPEQKTWSRERGPDASRDPISRWMRTATSPGKAGVTFNKETCEIVDLQV